MYTRLSKCALDRARNEARHLNIGATDTGHLLLGLTQEKRALARDILQGAGIPPQRIEEAVERFYKRLLPRLKTTTRNLLPLTRSFYLALEWAEEEAFHLGHEFIGTRHLVLGLLQLESSSANRVLRRFGLPPEKLYSLILEYNGDLEEAPGAPSVQWMFSWNHNQRSVGPGRALPSRALRKIILAAKERSILAGTEAVNAGHLLLSINGDRHSTVAQCLREGGFLTEELTAAAESYAFPVKPALSTPENPRRRTPLLTGMNLLAPAQGKALGWAGQATIKRRENRFGTLNHLTALLSDPTGRTAAIFTKAGFRPGRVRSFLRDWIAAHPERARSA